MIYQSGEKPGIGAYQCVCCDTALTLKSADDTLPSCPKCGGTDFVKI